MSPTFGMAHILRLLPSFLAQYPRIRPEWHFENRQVDLLAEGYDAVGREQAASLPKTIVVKDPAAMREAAALGPGVTLLAVPDALPTLENGALSRLLPGWYTDAAGIILYRPTRILLPTKTRAFVDHLAEAFARGRLAKRFAG